MRGGGGEGLEGGGAQGNTNFPLPIPRTPVSALSESFLLAHFHIIMFSVPRIPRFFAYPVEFPSPLNLRFLPACPYLHQELRVSHTAFQTQGSITGV